MFQKRNELTNQPFSALYEILDPDDDGIEQYGEIYVSNKNVLVLKCTVCNYLFSDMHILLEHRHKCKGLDDAETVEYLQHLPEEEEALELVSESKEMLEDLNTDDWLSEAQKDADIDQHNDDELLKDALELKTERKKGFCYDIPENGHSEGIDVEADVLVKHENIVRQYKEAIATQAAEDSENELKADAVKTETSSETAANTDSDSNHQSEAELYDNLLQCKKCGKYFKKKRFLKVHMETHSDVRKYKCEYCGMAFKTQTTQWEHVQRHKGIKKQKCEFCGKAFQRPSELKVHKRIHTGEKPYICSYCGQGYASSSKLTQHVKYHKNQRSHVCPNCGKSFYSSSHLKYHMLVHSDQRNFECELCHAVFKQKHSLHVHKKIHANAREYKCKICNKGFNQRAGLSVHLKVHDLDQILFNVNASNNRFQGRKSKEEKMHAIR